jgi:hypothetical protein
MNRERTMHDGHRTAGLTPATAIGAAGLAAGIMLAGGISNVPSPQPPTPGPLAIVITGNGPRAIIIGDPGGDGPGPKAVVIPVGGPLL